MSVITPQDEVFAGEKFRVVNLIGMTGSAWPPYDSDPSKRYMEEGDVVTAAICRPGDRMLYYHARQPNGNSALSSLLRWRFERYYDGSALDGVLSALEEISL